MQYHVRSLVTHGFMVDFIGYPGSPLPSSITDHVTIRHLTPAPRLLASLPRLLAYVIKTLWQSVMLLLSLPLFSHLDFLLVQTPPGVPSLPVLWLYCTLKGTRLVVDWHNYSHTILALALGDSHPLVRLTQQLERVFGSRASSAFCVTRAMSEDLRTHWGAAASVLYDRPPDKFRPITAEERRDLFRRLTSDYPVFSDITADTRVLVSSTSWTEDEDFGVLLEALIRYEEAKIEGQRLPDLCVVITGKGPQKQHYLDKISTLQLRHVRIVTPWLEDGDYPKMLASADLGVCLHTSSSGLDLPMKVVDMFGCRLPVAAIR